MKIYKGTHQKQLNKVPNEYIFVFMEKKEKYAVTPSYLELHNFIIIIGLDKSGYQVNIFLISP